ncbi:MAG: hypothetical protein HYX66_04905 [Ignavibacteria bacterium]|nr:hypothetical protein [Ignavibacteria bacterium]
MNDKKPILHQSLSVGLLTLIVFLCTAEVNAQWKKLNLPGQYASGYYLDVFFLKDNPNYGWACSIEGFVVRTTDGGVTWQGSRTSRSFLESVQFLTPTIGYTSGPAGIYRSDDGGATWKDITPLSLNLNPGSGFQNSPWGSYFINQNEGVFLADGCGSVQRFYRTTDGGQNWQYTVDNIANGKLSDALIFRDGSGFAVGSGVLWRTTDYGANWVFHSFTGSRIWTEELTFYAGSILLPTAGNDCDGAPTGIGSLRYSTDNGFNFREFQTNANMFGSFLLDKNRGWGVGSNASVYYTEDAGRTWVLRNCGIKGDMDDIFFLDDTTGWVVGNGIYRSNFNQPENPVLIEPDSNLIELCKGDSVFIRASDGFSQYRWNDGVWSQGRLVSAEGTYIVSAFNELTCNILYDTLTIKYKPSKDPVIEASKTEICEGDSIELRLVGDFVSQSWSTKDSSKSIRIRKSGVYSVTTLDIFGCRRTAYSPFITVRPLPEPVITANRSTTICIDETVTLSAPPGLDKYVWSNGSTERAIVVSKAGKYAVTVTNEYGCTATSDSVSITVLDTKNKIEINLSSTNGDFIIADQIVGEKSCNYLTIRNVSLTEDLVIAKPWIIGNVMFSIPQAQLPIRIAPQQTATLELCASAIDTGLIEDTLYLPDTCSPTLVPLKTRGTSLAFEGTSRCSVGVSTLVIRAGKTYRLSAPYPMPANQQFAIEVEPAASQTTASMFDALGIERVRANVIRLDKNSLIEFRTDNLPVGVYQVVIEIDGDVVKSYTTIIQR